MLKLAIHTLADKRIQFENTVEPVSSGTVFSL